MINMLFGVISSIQDWHEKYNVAQSYSDLSFLCENTSLTLTFNSIALIIYWEFLTLKKMEGNRQIFLFCFMKNCAQTQNFIVLALYHFNKIFALLQFFKQVEIVQVVIHIDSLKEPVVTRTTGCVVVCVWIVSRQRHATNPTEITPALHACHLVTTINFLFR